MKRQLLIAGLFALGCTMDQPPQLRESSKASSANGEHLILLQVEVAIPNPKPRLKAYDFHSLVWRSNTNENKKVITRSDFSPTSDRPRWVSDVHSFEAEDGHAIIKVAEQGLPKDGRVTIQYSWRQWDLNNNREISVLHICDSPMDPFPEEEGR